MFHYDPPVSGKQDKFTGIAVERRIALDDVQGNISRQETSGLSVFGP